MPNEEIGGGGEFIPGGEIVGPTPADPTPSGPATPADEDGGFRWTRKQLIAMGAPIKPLTREEYLLSGDKESIGSPLNVKEQVLASVVGGGEEPTGTITITENGTGIDVAQYATADVNVPSSGVDLTKIGTVTFVADDTSMQLIGGIWQTQNTDTYKSIASVPANSTTKYDLYAPSGESTVTILLINPGAKAVAGGANVVVSGNASKDGTYLINVTGNCTISYSS